MAESLSDIRETLDLIGDDWDERYRYIIELGRQLPPLPEGARTAENKVRGCASQVWLVVGLSDETPPRLTIVADSDAHIVRGLIAILIAIFAGRTPKDAATLDVRQILNELQLAQALSPTRTNGLYAMVGRIQELARAATLPLP